MLSSGAVAADSNGFFHPLGDHAQTSFSVDGQPISDQQSKAFSTQIPLDAIQSMELITGAPPAEFGDKTSLIVNAVTRSGLGQKPNGSFMAQWGSFATYSEEATFGTRRPEGGKFPRSQRAAFWAVSGHARASRRFMRSATTAQSLTISTTSPTARDVFHLNVLAARNWFQIPNTYDQPGQDQRQKISTFNFAPGYQHIFSANTLLDGQSLLSARPRELLSEPADITLDTPATISQHRTLTNWGVKADLSIVKGRHNFKVGTQLMQTRLHEQFAFGITDPTRSGVPGCRTGTSCPDCFPYDLTRRAGSCFSSSEHQYQSVRLLCPGQHQVRKSQGAGGPARGFLSRNRHGLERAAAHRILLPAQADRNRVARFLLAHVRNALQREPDPFERHGRGRARVECLRSGEPAPAARNSQPIQRRAGTGFRAVSGRQRRLFLEVHQ